jgi:hypothetical protein
MKMPTIKFENGAQGFYLHRQGPRVVYFDEKGNNLGNGGDMRRNFSEYDQLEILDEQVCRHGYMGVWQDEVRQVTAKSWRKARAHLLRRLKAR